MAARQVLYIFPGQGSQYPGIGSHICEEYPQAADIYARANEAAGYDLKTLSFFDPDNCINLTRYTQPVLLTHSIACLEVFKTLTGGNISPVCVAGHSLGEYSALVAAGVLEFEDALTTVIRRGELMSDLGTGEMSAFSASYDDIKALAETHYCGIAGCNLPDQTVIGGATADLNRLEQQMQELHPKKRFTRLKTEGAFHTYYMVAAARKFRLHLDQTGFAQTNCGVLSNYTGNWHEDDAGSIRAKLFYQLFNPVMWHKNLLTAADSGIDTIIEFGGGIGKGETAAEKRPNLEGIVKKAFRQSEIKPEYFSAINYETLEATVATLA